MTNEPDEKAGDRPQDDDAEAEQDRPTVAPPFDPVMFAKEVRGGKPSPAAGTRAAGYVSAAHVREGREEREEPSEGFWPTRPPMPTLTDPVELEVARQKSLGSRPVPRRPSVNDLGPIRSARGLPSPPPQRAIRPKPARAPSQVWDEMPTTPPPPMEQELIDAFTRDAHAGRGSAVREEPAPSFASKAPVSPPAHDHHAAPNAKEMHDRVSLGDYTGALDIAERLLEVDGTNDSVLACAERCRTVLKQMHTERIGPLDRVPIVMVARDQLRWLSIDHRAGFVLSLVDGVSSLEMILDVSGMPELDALRILSELAQQRIISFR